MGSRHPLSVPLPSDSRCDTFGVDDVEDRNSKHHECEHDSHVRTLATEPGFAVPICRSVSGLGQSGRMVSAPRDPDDRSFSAYLRSLRSPGLALRVAAAATFGLALAIEKGVRTLAFVILGVIAFAVLVIYPYFRRRGPD